MLCSQNKMWTIFVHKTDRECKLEPLDGGSGPTLAAPEKQRPQAPDARPLPGASAATLTLKGEAAVTRSRSLQQWAAKPPLTYVRQGNQHTHVCVVFLKLSRCSSWQSGAGLMAHATEPAALGCMAGDTAVST